MGFLIDHIVKSTDMITKYLLYKEAAKFAYRPPTQEQIKKLASIEAHQWEINLPNR